MQQRILKDAFPNYNSGTPIMFTDCEEGREHLAFENEANQPVFLFIDNALRTEDLKQLLSDDLQGLPKQSRITRKLGITDMLVDAGLQRHPYPVKPLPDIDATKILFNGIVNLDHMKDDVEKIFKHCNGIPLVLKIVGAHLKKQGYKADKCERIIDALLKGEEIKEEHLSERMVDFVYKEMEASTKEAFLDICSFLWESDSRYVEYIVGAEDFTSLKDSALITSVPRTYEEIEAFGPVEVLMVHDVIRAQGRRMAESRRIMDLQSLKEAIEHQKLKEIKGVWLLDDYSEYVLEERHINSMRKSLRILALGMEMSVRGQSDKAFQELRCLIIGEETPFLPVNSEVLDRLAVCQGPIFKNGISLYKLPKHLRGFYSLGQESDEGRNWEESKPMQIVPNSSLEELFLFSCHGQEKVFDRLHNLIALKILNISNTGIEELPQQVCELSSLHSLRALSFKRLPLSFGKHQALTFLNLKCSKKMEELSSTIGQLKSLEYINLWGCKKLKELPSTFGNSRL